VLEAFRQESQLQQPELQGGEAGEDKPHSILKAMVQGQAGGGEPVGLGDELLRAPTHGAAVAGEDFLGGRPEQGLVKRSAGEAGRAGAEARPDRLAEALGVVPVLDGGCPAGEAWFARGYRLPGRWATHTAGPVWQGGGSGADGMLAACHRSRLEGAARSTLAGCRRAIRNPPFRGCRPRRFLP